MDKQQLSRLLAPVCLLLVPIELPEGKVTAGLLQNNAEVMGAQTHVWLLPRAQQHPPSYSLPALSQALAPHSPSADRRTTASAQMQATQSHSQTNHEAVAACGAGLGSGLPVAVYWHCCRLLDNRRLVTTGSRPDPPLTTMLQRSVQSSTTMTTGPVTCKGQADLSTSICVLGTADHKMLHCSLVLVLQVLKLFWAQTLLLQGLML